MFLLLYNEYEAMSPKTILNFLSDIFAIGPLNEKCRRHSALNLNSKSNRLLKNTDPLSFKIINYLQSSISVNHMVEGNEFCKYVYRK